MTDISFLLVPLRKLDRVHLSPRDILVMESVRENPGSMGREVAMRLGLPSRSNVQDNIRRTIFQGMVEDRRVAINKLTPNELYITPAGAAFLDDLGQPVLDL